MAADGRILNANDQMFDEVVAGSDRPVLVDFWAPWCVSCRIVTPIVEDLEHEFRGRVTFVKVNVDEAQEVASSLGIDAIPAIVVFNRGNRIASQIGARPRAVLEEMVERLLVEDTMSSAKSRSC